ncbi:MAG: helix-turn-helix domain-containing protein, partial [Sciscionella sp.]
MGKVMHAFRTHPYHGRDISQESAAGWVGLSQSGLSRIENGEPLSNLGKLMRWAHVLGIPDDLLWFAVSSPHPDSVATLSATKQVAEVPAAPASSGCVLLPVVVNGRSVLVPLSVATVADNNRLRTELESVVTTASEWEGMSPLDRRAFLTRGLAVSALPALGLGEIEHVAAALGDSRRYLDGSVVNYFRRQLGVCMTDDGAFGATRTLPAVLGLV